MATAAVGSDSDGEEHPDPRNVETMRRSSAVLRYSTTAVTAGGDVEVEAGREVTITHRSGDGLSLFAEIEGSQSGWLPRDAISPASSRVVVAVFCFDGASIPEALSLTAGELLSVEEDRGDWLFGSRLSNREACGIFPASYVAEEREGAAVASRTDDEPLGGALLAATPPTLASLCACAFPDLHGEMLRDLRAHCSRELAQFLLLQLGASRRQRELESAHYRRLASAVAAKETEVAHLKETHSKLRLQLANAKTDIERRDDAIFGLQKRLRTQQSKTARLENFVWLKERTDTRGERRGENCSNTGGADS